MFPRWSLADGKLKERLANPSLRRESAAGRLDFIDEQFGDEPSRIQPARCGPDPALSGQTVADLLGDAGPPMTQAATAAMVMTGPRIHGRMAPIHGASGGLCVSAG